MSNNHLNVFDHCLWQTLIPVISSTETVIVPPQTEKAKNELAFPGNLQTSRLYSVDFMVHYLSPIVQHALWAPMLHFLSVCLGTRGCHRGVPLQHMELYCAPSTRVVHHQPVLCTISREIFSIYSDLTRQICPPQNTWNISSVVKVKMLGQVKNVPVSCFYMDTY